jgi:putative tryptophan/tyrosine transport system substrate-binding protein
MSLRYEASAKAAESLGVTVQALGVREPDDFNDVFETMDREPPRRNSDGVRLAHNA